MGKKVKYPSFILDKDLQQQLNNRTLLIHGWVKLRRGQQKEKQYLLLYQDLLIVAQIKRKKLNIKNKIHLKNMWLASHVNEKGKGNNSITSFILGWPTVNYMATFNSWEQKEKWLYLLQRYINMEKETDDPKKIPIKIFLKDIGNPIHYKTVTVRNTDSTSDIISKSLPMLRINGSEKDYQLWVDSGKAAAPYPLMGHECPYAIKMCNFQEMKGSKDSTTTSHLLEPFPTEDVPLKKCQFILQPRHLTVSQQPNGWNHLRRSFINWACCCGSSTDLDTSPMPATSPTPGQLFGVPLEDICEGENLPKPVLDMLYYINEKGPFTRGIFRVPGSMDFCEELKEKLNKGLEVNLDCEHCEQVFVVASVLKDFLRCIPDSVFSSYIYHEWISILDKDSKEERINSIQSLFKKLPRLNLILINILFGVLKKIEKNSMINQMTAYNLAVCIGPSLLWTTTFSSLIIELKCTKQVCSLIEFIIENADLVFESRSSPWGEDLMPHDNSKDSPGHEYPQGMEVSKPEVMVLEPFVLEQISPKVKLILKPNHLAMSQKPSVVPCVSSAQKPQVSHFSRNQQTKVKMASDLEDRTMISINISSTPLHLPKQLQAH